MTLTKLSNLLTPMEFEAFTSSFGSLIEEYRKTSTLKLEQLVPILGNPPRIPQSPDMDAMMEAYEARALYGMKSASIEEYISQKVNV